ncbi:MAG: hypothetical protein LDLANPLL_02829 [Turneriella sp.]|nr:hypothetical protein [Turneriella sp.]
MEIFTIIKNTDKNGEFEVRLKSSRPNSRVEAVVIVAEEMPQTSKPDILKFFGKMQWQGDALTEQRQLRDEWQ